MDKYENLKVGIALAFAFGVFLGAFQFLQVLVAAQ